MFLFVYFPPSLPSALLASVSKLATCGNRNAFDTRHALWQTIKFCSSEIRRWQQWRGAWLRPPTELCASDSFKRKRVESFWFSVNKWRNNREHARSKCSITRVKRVRSSGRGTFSGWPACRWLCRVVQSCSCDRVDGDIPSGLDEEKYQYTCIHNVVQKTDEQNMFSINHQVTNKIYLVRSVITLFLFSIVDCSHCILYLIYWKTAHCEQKQNV